MSADPAAIESLAYDAVWPAHITRHSWTGSVEGCDPGSIPQTHYPLALAAINGFREIEGLDPVTFNAAYNTQAQAAALIMTANSALSHYPPSTWKCWTQQGADGASHSNLTINTSAVSSMSYMDDGGDNNHAAGHRGWILRPQLDEMGIGLTDNTGALYVVTGGDDTYSNPDFIAWPTAGYFPISLEPRGRWSLDGTDSSVDFQSASVAMTGPDGPLHVTTWNPDYAGGQLVWDTFEVPWPQSMTVPTTFTVRISGWLKAGVPQADIVYSTTLLPARTFAARSAPTISGDLRSGGVLVAKNGSWTKTAYRPYFSYRWIIDGHAVSGRRGSASTLLLRPEDEGSHTIQVRVTGSVDDGPDTRWWRPGSAYGTVQAVVGKGRLTSLRRPRLEQPTYRALRAVGTRWNLPPSQVKYKWIRNGVLYAVTKTPRLDLVRKDHGRRFRVEAVARRDGYGRAVVRSKAYVTR